jgi:proteasome alpha subunit
MSMPFYVSPEQLMKDRADFARKNIARGRPVVVVQFADGVLFVAENQSKALHKISEIYDRLAFAAVGRYNEFENLRIAGVRLADMRGYSYDRRDVTGRGLANAYAQTLGTIFSSGGEKPYEVEIFVAEVGDTSDDDQIYRLTYDGSVADEHGYAVMGGLAEQVSGYLEEHYVKGLDLVAALQVAVRALTHDVQPPTLTVDRLEVALLDRTRTQPRKFRRISGERLGSLFALAMPKDSEAPPAADVAAEGPEPAATVDPPQGGPVEAAPDGALDDDVLGDLPPDPVTPDKPDE